jgi:hypothetical protein
VTLVDSNVLIDIFGGNPQWWPWSLARVQQALRVGPVLINDIVYAETSIRFGTIDDFDAALTAFGATLAPSAWHCLSPVRPLRGTEVSEAFVPACYRTFSSARMRR